MLSSVCLPMNRLHCACLRFLLRPSALELFMADRSTALLNFPSAKVHPDRPPLALLAHLGHACRLTLQAQHPVQLPPAVMRGDESLKARQKAQSRVCRSLLSEIRSRTSADENLTDTGAESIRRPGVLSLRREATSIRRAETEGVTRLNFWPV